MKKQDIGNEAEESAEEVRPDSVGDEIRTIRKARGLTLKQLSRDAGCSAAYLSRIERGEARISIDLLTRIGELLHVDPRWFFPNRPGQGNHEKAFVVRQRDRRPISQLYTRSPGELGFDDELLSSSLAGGCYMMLTRFAPGSEVKPAVGEAYAYEGEQHGYVIQGAIELILDGESIILNAGDSFSYPTRVPHRMRNAIDQESVAVITMMPVRINW